MQFTDLVIPQEIPTQAIEFLSSVGDAFKAYPYTMTDAFEAAGYSDINKYPVYILLTRGHTPLAKMITTVTGDEWSHSSISFNIKLDPLYSFGTKKLSGKGSNLGFIMSSANDPLWGDKPCRYALYVTFVDAAAYRKMQNRLEWFKDHGPKLKYDFGGLVTNLFRLPRNTQAKWFCSRFVAEILSSGKSIDKDPSKYRPQQLSGLTDVELLDEGPSIREYNWKIANAKLQTMKTYDDIDVSSSDL